MMGGTEPLPDFRQPIVVNTSFQLIWWRVGRAAFASSILTSRLARNRISFGDLAMKVSSCVLGGVLTLLAVCTTSCSTSDLGAPTASNNGKYYAVSVKQAAFYLYGPQQANGPDQKLPQDTLMMLIRPSFGYSKVKLMNGQQGYVATQDIRAAPPELVSAATAPTIPSNSNETGRTPKFRFDPRSIPAEPLPNDAPEPTPIPETEASPSP